ncbi:hypothetical protein, partial [Parabacteroides johnsonii]|uniref:hypothetical protein n=1 Tax=Parabacteroides johnsonii TaxID=387661 RepID=UPI00265D499B
AHPLRPFIESSAFSWDGRYRLFLSPASLACFSAIPHQVREQAVPVPRTGPQKNCRNQPSQ